MRLIVGNLHMLYRPRGTSASARLKRRLPIADVPERAQAIQAAGGKTAAVPAPTPEGAAMSAAATRVRSAAVGAAARSSPGRGQARTPRRRRPA